MLTLFVGYSLQTELTMRTMHHASNGPHGVVISRIPVCLPPRRLSRRIPLMGSLPIESSGRDNEASVKRLAHASECLRMAITGGE